MNEHIAQYIADAIKNNSVEIKYQPQFELCRGRYEVIGVEALLRPDPDICSIDKFLSVAVETNQIIELGYWVLKQTAIQLRDWIDHGIVGSRFAMSVNVDAEQLQDDQLYNRVMEIINDCNIEPHQIVLELTETSLLNDANITKIDELAKAGINFSIDDFGTGYSSLARLKFLPANEIKIDKIFVDDITKTDQGETLIAAIYQLTQALNKVTIVEGVESKDQLHILRKIGFACFQGFYFSEAISAEEFEEMINLTDYSRC